jgi:hypothetical protein
MNLCMATSTIQQKIKELATQTYISSRYTERQFSSWPICQYVIRTYFFTHDHYYSQITLQTLCPEKTDHFSSLTHSTVKQKWKTGHIISFYPMRSSSKQGLVYIIYAQLTVAVPSYLRYTIFCFRFCIFHLFKSPFSP